MKFIKYIIITSLLLVLASCSSDVEKVSNSVEKSPVKNSPAVIENEILDGLSLSVGENIDMKDDLLRIPLILDYTGTKTVSIQGVTVYIKGLGKVSENVSLTTSELTDGWLVASHLDMDEDQLKGAMVSLKPLSQYGVIGYVEIDDSNVSINDLMGHDYEAYVEVATNKVMFKTNNTILKL